MPGGVVDGALTTGQGVRFMGVDREERWRSWGSSPPRGAGSRVGRGEVGYLFAGLKDLRLVRVGDTVTDNLRPAAEALPGFLEAKPMVFAGLYPVDSSAFGELRDALEKLSLNDSALSHQPTRRKRSGSGSDAGFSACYTWRSFRSVSSASSTWS